MPKSSNSLYRTHVIIERIRQYDGDSNEFKLKRKLNHNGGEMRHNIFAFSLVFLLVFTMALFAQGFYFGAGIGNTFFSSEVNDALDQVKEIDENSTAWKIFGGLHLTDFLNAEGGYRSFGNVSSRIITDLFESKTTGWDVEGVGRLQIVILDLFAKAGAMFWSTKASFGGLNLDNSGTDFFWGLGVGAHLGSLGARLEWESVAIGGPENLSMVSLSATIGF
jgi:hypothetical protein